MPLQGTVYATISFYATKTSVEKREKDCNIYKKKLHATARLVGFTASRLLARYVCSRLSNNSFRHSQARLCGVGGSGSRCRSVIRTRLSLKFEHKAAHNKRTSPRHVYWID
jgi:hypothetical protein